jgi:hypothetical protein
MLNSSLIIKQVSYQDYQGIPGYPVEARFNSAPSPGKNHRLLGMPCSIAFFIPALEPEYSPHICMAHKHVSHLDSGRKLVSPIAFAVKPTGRIIFKQLMSGFRTLFFLCSNLGHPP